MRAMAAEEDDDLYDEEFDFVDDDEEEEGEEAEGDEADGADEPLNGEADGEEPAEGDEPLDEYGRPETPPANYVVHIYEHKKFTRTIDRPFTPEDAEAFATEFNRTSKNYGRMAVSGKVDAKPKKVID
jgi:hypothetical protein